jgi:hypothetical protein
MHSSLREVAPGDVLRPTADDLVMIAMDGYIDSPRLDAFAEKRDQIFVRVEGNSLA